MSPSQRSANVCIRGNGPLRDFAAQCMAEFFNWCLKQTRGTSQAEQFVGRPLTVIKKLFALSAHPDPYKRVRSLP